MSDNKYVTKFFTASVILFLIGSFQGGLQQLYHDAIESMPLGGLIIGMHTHISLLGWTSLALMGAIYLLLPMSTGKPIYSIKLANIGFWFSAIFVTIQYVLGISLALTTGAYPELGLLLLISTPLMGVGVWIFIGNVLISVARKA